MPSRLLYEWIWSLSRQGPKNLPVRVAGGLSLHVLACIHASAVAYHPKLESISLTCLQSLSQQQKASHVFEVISQRQGSNEVLGEYITVFSFFEAIKLLNELIYRPILAAVDESAWAPKLSKIVPPNDVFIMLF